MISNSILFCSYNVVSSILVNFGLVLEHSKTEVFYFSRAQGIFNPPPLNLLDVSSPILKPKNTWKYLGFIFNRKLLLHQHINFYANKAILTIKCMKILRDAIRDLISLQKHLFYRSYILPITLYGSQLWFYNRTPLSYLLRVLNQMQWRAAIWILGMFHTFPSFGIETITGLIPINLYLHKLSDWAQLRVHSLPHNHILWSLLELRPSDDLNQHSLSLNSLTYCQRENINGSIIDMDNRFNEVFSSFDPLNVEFSPSSRLIDVFSSHFLF